MSADTEPQTTRSRTGADVLHIIRQLSAELRPQLQGGKVIELHSDLDADAGLDSLSRAELLLRLERAFHVRLPEHLISDAATPDDFVDAILKAGPADAGERRDHQQIEPALPVLEAPATAATLTEALEFHCQGSPDRPHIWLPKSDGEEECITYQDLYEGARSVAGGLQARGLEPGERVAIMLPTEAAFFHSFFGILLAGGIPVPIYPPFRRAQIEDHLRRQAGILNNCQAVMLVTDPEIHRLGELLHSLTSDLRSVELAQDLAACDRAPAVFTPSGSTTALIQYTSGSTGDPKGVVLSHANLLANVRSMGQAMNATSQDVFVSWLPLYHDMGLIGAWLGCLYYAVPTTIMPPLAFLADPARWLWAIHRHKATLSAAPNFAYELCVKNIRDSAIDGLDLSSLRMVVNGAEPVSPSTLQAFSERFAMYGFRPEALAPVYGLAENAVGLAFPPPNRLPIVDRIDRNALSRAGVARAATAGDDTALSFVACGQPLPGHQIRIVDTVGRELPERREGMLHFKGPSSTSGYFRNDAKNRDLFAGDWLNSGDRAYIANGDIFLTGRNKDLIIRGGRNIYPHELEHRVGDIEGVRKGCVAAFAGRDSATGTESLVLLAETRWRDEDKLAGLRADITAACAAVAGLPPDHIVLAPPRSVPKTSSGKIRRSEARRLYEEGLIGKPAKALWWQLARLSASAARQRILHGLGAAWEKAYAGWWWLCLIGLAVVVWPAVLILPVRAWRHKVVSACARVWFKLTGIGFSVCKDADTPPHSVILVANHASYLDSLVLSTAIPGPLAFVAKQDLAGQSVAGPFLRRLGTLFARRMDTQGGLRDTEHMRQRTRDGERAVFFAEGTLTRMPGVLQFHLGAFHIAVQNGLPVQPVTIKGTRSVLRGEQWFPRRGDLSVHLGELIAPDGDDFDAAVRLRNKVRGAILEESGEPDLAHEQVEMPSN